MGQLIEILVLLLLSATKFAFAATYLLFDKGFGYWHTVLILLSGGITGVFIFYFLGSWITTKYYQYKKNSTPKKRFTKFNRFLVKIKYSYGIYGIAFLTPILLSIPVGSIVLSRYFYNDKKRNIGMLIVSVLFWSLALPLITEYIV
ncbi:MAG: hypothetical protein Kow0079_09740 [Vicingaceae bacterium]|jgi:membrane protease YdiL (CAAX protease family)